MMKKETYIKSLNLLFATIILAKLIYMTIALFVERSLWLDEALLVKSICVRDFAGLLEGNLEYGQSSPVGYLMVSKLFTIIFGVRELSFRLYGYLFTIASAIIVYYLAKDALKSKLPLLIVVGYLSVNTILNYANEAKPYSSDAFCTLMTFYLYWKYRVGKCSLLSVCIFMTIAVWFTLGGLFSMAGICIYHFFDKIIEYRKKSLNITSWLKSVLPLLIVGVSVLLYYILWLGPASANIEPEAHEYWDKTRIPLLPTSIEELKSIIRAFKAIFYIHGNSSIYFLLFFIFSVVKFRKNWINVSLVITLAIVIVASHLGLYHIESRLQLGLISLITLYVYYGMSEILSGITYNKATLTCSLLFIILPFLYTNKACAKMFKKDSYYNKGDEYKACLEYIEEKTGKDAIIYCYGTNKPIVEFYRSYKDKVSSFGFNRSSNIYIESNIIYANIIRQLTSPSSGEYLFIPKKKEMNQNVDVIRKFPEVYIINVHQEGDIIPQLLSLLKSKGSNVTLFNEIYETEIFKITTSGQ